MPKFTTTETFKCEYIQPNDTLIVRKQLFDEIGNEWFDVYETKPIGYEGLLYGEILFYQSSFIHEPIKALITAYRATWEDRKDSLATLLANFFSDSEGRKELPISDQTQKTARDRLISALSLI